jgi:dTDP-4-amino-4,6-dideoxygalactose transaminase
LLQVSLFEQWLADVANRIYLSPPDVGPEERAHLLAAFDSNWIAPVGPDLNFFEDELAVRTGRQHAVALASGTAAIHLGLLASGIEPGSPIAVSTFTFAGSLNPLMYVGADITLIDSEPDTWDMDPALLRAECERRYRAGLAPFQAVLVVDLYGQPANYQAISEVSAEFGIRVLSDAAESLGATFAGQPAGSFGDWAALSFNGNKIITTGGGGALVTDDQALADRVRYLSTQARRPVAHYEHVDVGYNYRLSNLLAALGRGQLGNLDIKIEKRKAIELRYQAGFDGISGIRFMPRPAQSTPNHWLTCITLDPSLIGPTPNEVREELETHNIEARQLWKPMHQQPVFAHLDTALTGVSDNLFATGLCLPSGSSLAVDEQDRVIDAVRRAIA